MRVALRAAAAAVAMACAGNVSAIVLDKDLGSLTPPVNATFSATVAGNFTYNVGFNLTAPGAGTAVATNVSITISGVSSNVIDTFGGTLSGPGGFSQALDFSSSPITGLPSGTGTVQLLTFGADLNPGDYLLAFTGDAGGQADFAGKLLILPSPVPLPMAGWLFGSAVLGLVAIGRRPS